MVCGKQKCIFLSFVRSCWICAQDGGKASFFFFVSLSLLSARCLCVVLFVILFRKKRRNQHRFVRAFWLTPRFVNHKSHTCDDTGLTQPCVTRKDHQLCTNIVITLRMTISFHTYTLDQVIESSLGSLHKVPPISSHSISGVASAKACLPSTNQMP